MYILCFFIVVQKTIICEYAFHKNFQKNNYSVKEKVTLTFMWINRRMFKPGTDLKFEIV